MPPRHERSVPRISGSADTCVRRWPDRSLACARAGAVRSSVCSWGRLGAGGDLPVHRFDSGRVRLRQESDTPHLRRVEKARHSATVRTVPRPAMEGRSCAPSRARPVTSTCRLVLWERARSMSSNNQLSVPWSIANFRSKLSAFHRSLRLELLTDPIAVRTRWLRDSRRRDGIYPSYGFSLAATFQGFEISTYRTAAAESTSARKLTSRGEVPRRISNPCSPRVRLFAPTATPKGCPWPVGSFGRRHLLTTDPEPGGEVCG